MIAAPDSAAQIPVQAAEYLRRFGALIPWDVCPPLLPVLIAALGLVGLPETGAYALVVLTAYFGGCYAMYVLAGRFQPAAVATLAAFLFAIAPSRLPPASLEQGPFLVFWSLAPVLLIALDSVRRRPGAANVPAAGLVALLMLSARPSGIDARELLALAELILILAAVLAGFVAARRIALACFAATAVWMLLFGQSTPPSLSSELLAATGLEPGSRRLFGPVSLAREMNPIQDQASDVIRAPGRRSESIMWLRAMAVEYLVSRDRQKYGGILECLEERDGWCVFGIPEPNPAPALVASRHQWENLPLIRGLYDIEGLQQYLAWSGRPEAAGFRWVDGSSIEIRADLGPFDVFLVRVNCQSGWSARLIPAPDSEAVAVSTAVEAGQRVEIPIECDPVGFMMIDPKRVGETRILLEYPGPSSSGADGLFVEGMREDPLPSGDFPRITPGGVVEAVGFTPPPFEPGASLSIFGHHFDPENTQVSFGEMPGEVLWTSPQQVNAQVPGSVPEGQVAVVVESNGRRSFAEGIAIER